MKKVLAMAALAFAMVAGLKADSDAKMTVSGNVDANYGVLGNMQSNGFAIDEARAILKGSGSDVSGMLEMKMVNVAGTPALNSVGITTTPNTESVQVSQAFLTSSMSMLTLKLGQFYNPVRLEAVDVSDRDNVSASLLGAGEVSTFLGAELVLAPMDMLKIGVVAANPQNEAGKQAKDFGAFVSLTPMKELNVKAGYLFEPLLIPSAIDGSPIFEDMHSIVADVKWDVMDNLSLGGEYLYSTLIASSATDAAGDLASPLQMLDPSTGKAVVLSPKTQGYTVLAKYATPLWDIVLVPRFSAAYQPDVSPVKADFQYTLTFKKTTGPLTSYLEVESDASNLAVYSQGDGKDMVYSNLGVTLGCNYAF